LGEFGGLGPLGGECFPPPDLLGHWAFAPEVGAHWMVSLILVKKIKKRYQVSRERTMM